MITTSPANIHHHTQLQRLFTVVRILRSTLLAPFEYTCVRACSVAQTCPTLCDPLVCSMPGLPVHHRIQELTQTHVHQMGDSIPSSHSLSSPSSPAFNLSYHQSLFMSQFFASGGQPTGASPSVLVLPRNIQD